MIQKRKYILESVKGYKKRENQDNYLILEESDYTLYFVFDGVGSALNSKKATDISKKYISNNHEAFHFDGNYNFSKLMYYTNNFLLEKNIPEVKTTFCAIFISKNFPNKILYSSLGDSRAYIVSPQYLIQITEDDRYLSLSNVITKCLGMRELEISDFFTKEYDVSFNDQILLCTDGFYTLLEKDKELYFQTLNMQYLNSIKKRLHKLVKDNNIDDSTYIFIK